MKEEKNKLKKIRQIKLLWEDIDAFDDEQLIQLKQIHHIKTQNYCRLFPTSKR